MSTLAGTGDTAWADGTGTAASFYRPSRLDFDSSGNVFVADGLNDRIRVVTTAGKRDAN